MQKWEYRVVPEEIDWDDDSGKPYGIDKGRLAQLGNEGWELVGMAPVNGALDDGSSCTVEIQYLFKRPKATEERKPVDKPQPVLLSAEDVALIQSFVDRHPTSELAKSGVAGRIQGAVAKAASSNGKH